MSGKVFKGLQGGERAIGVYGNGAPWVKPMVPKRRPQGANIPYQRTIHPRVEPVVLLVRDRGQVISFRR